MNLQEFSFDALMPPAMADKAEQIGIKKANSSVTSLFVLGILAGAFISIGAIFSIAATAGLNGVVPFGLIKLISGVTFSVGLILVVVGGAELFTGNTLIIMAFANRKVGINALLRNWVIVYFSNFVGAILTAGLIFFAGQYTFGKGEVGANMLAIAEAKTSLSFIQAVVLGILCNAVVCMAIWLTFSARSTTDKILAITPPITAFIAAGFEHSIANMFFIPAALFIKVGAGEAFFASIGSNPEAYANLTWANFFLANLIPVTIGNIIGGALMVGLIYWFVYLRTPAVVAPASNVSSAPYID